MTIEKLEFKLTLCPRRVIAKNKIPEFKIAINNQNYIHSRDLFCDSDSDRVEVKFPVELSFGNNDFKLSFMNKESGDSIYENNKIVDDLYVHITKIEVDNINITALVKKLSVYRPNSPVFYNNILHNEFREHNFLTWNGVWSFSFQTPFYKWLIDQL